MIMLPIFKGLTMLFDGVSKLLNALFEGMSGFKWFRDMISGGLNMTQDMIVKIEVLGVFLKKTWDSMIDSLVAMLKKLPEFFDKLGTGIGDAYRSVKGGVSDFVFGGEAKQDRTWVGDIADFFTGTERSVMGGYQAPTNTKTVTTNNNNVNNSSTTTNVFGNQGSIPDYLMKNPYDLTGRPIMSGGY